MGERVGKVIGYLALTAVTLCYTGGIVTAQLLGRTYPRFELNLFRLLSHSMLCLCVVLIVRKNAFGISGCKDISLLIVGASAFTWAVLTMNLAPLYAPVGNLESVGITVFILMNILIGLFRKTASCALAVAAVVSCIGVICLTQPDFLFLNSDAELYMKDPCPCAAIQRDSTDDRIAECHMTALSGEVSHVVFTPENTSKHFAKTIAPNDVIATRMPKDSYQDSPIPGMASDTFGYVLMISQGITFSVSMQITEKCLLLNHHFAAISLWYGVIGMCISAVVTFGFERLRLVGGNACIAFFILHIFCSSVTNILNNASLMYVSSEENAVISALCVVTLFIAQCTFLSDIQPSHGNAYEYIGACLIFVASLLEPLHRLVAKRRGVSVMAKRCGVAPECDTCPKKPNEHSEEINIDEKTHLLNERKETSD